MCGVFAYAGKREVDMQACLARLAHRGPDHTGTLRDGDVQMGHCRLAIIDPDPRSSQPLTSVSGRTTVVFNGEIYNYRALRRQLAGEGASFKTESDTEVLLVGYERHGVQFFERLRGMWALVIYDREKEELIAARDPYGIKPLYLARKDDSVYFVSEIRSLKGAMTLEPDPSGYPVFYNLGYFLAPTTPYKNVFALRPGENLSVDLATSIVTTLHRVSRFAGTPTPPDPYADSAELLDASLTGSVEAHYVADVPVSILLSGGNDSSLIAALSHKLGKRPEAYHVAIAGSKDTRYAQAVAKHLGIHLSIEPLDQAALSKQYEKVWDILDEPTGDISIIPTSLVYERIKGRAKVVLSGEGGDELFGGYLRHRALAQHTSVSASSAVNTLFNGMLGNSARSLSVWNPLVQRTRAALLRRGVPDDLIGAYLRGVRLLDYPLEDAAVRGALFEEYAAGRDERTPQALTFDTIAYLPNDLLYKSDIASMASSIEARVPLVDRFLASDASAALAQAKGTIGDKRLLKDVLLRYLPHELVFRGKQGFGVPMHAYDSRAFVSDFDKACRFHLAHRDAFAVGNDLARLIGSVASREIIARKYPRFAFALISNWKAMQ